MYAKINVDERNFVKFLDTAEYIGNLAIFLNSIRYIVLNNKSLALQLFIKLFSVVEQDINCQ